MTADPFIDRLGFVFVCVAVVIAAVGGLGGFLAPGELLDEIFLVGSWAIALNDVVYFKGGIRINPHWRRQSYIRNFLIPFSTVATILYLMGAIFL